MNKLVFSTLFALTAISPQDEHFNQQWYLKNTGITIKRDITEISSYAVEGKSGADIHFPFHLKELTGPRKQVVVAVLDTGVDIEHAELKESILKSSECNSLGQLPPANSPDLDANGFKGDCAGWNFASSKNADGDNQVYDDTGHGTHLSGLIAGKSNALGIRGISDQIKILPVKIFNKYEISGHPLRPKMKMMERIQRGLEYAIHKNVDVINLSLGWPSVLDSPKIRSLFELAAQKNILVVAAAGNNAHHTTIFPCSYPSVLCVGATTVDGTVAPFSNFGGNVDLMAPGENILSTIPKKITPLYFDEDGFDYKNGTSQAAPLVAGSAALMKLVLGDISVGELKARLFSAAKRTNSDLSSLFGDLNLSAAIESLPEQFIYPNLKELNTVEVGYPNGRFSFEVVLDQLLPAPLVNGRVSLELGVLKLDQTEYDFSYVGKNSIKIHVSGAVPDFKSSSTQILSMNLSYLGSVHHFKKEITFALDANQVGSKVHFEEKVSADSFKSVDDSFRLSAQTLFYTTEVSGAQQSLTFFAAKGDKLKKEFVITKASDLKLLAAVMVRSDLLGVEFYDATNKKLIYDFWDTTKALQVKSLEMIPDSAVFTLHQSVHLQNPSKSALIKAVLLTNGKIPPSEANKSVFLNSQTGASDHLYYFEEKDGKINTAMLDNEFFRNSLIKKYHLRFDDEIVPMAVLSEGVSAKVDTLIVIGKGYQRKVLAITFTDRNEFVITREYMIPGGAALKAISFLGKTMILTQERKDAYLMFDLETAKFSTYEWNDRNDDLLSPIAAVGTNQLLAQTQNHFVVLNSKTMQSSSAPQSIALKRFSFLPGELFSEMFTPVKVETSGEQLPGLFIDGTMISEKHIGVVLWDGKKMVKPIYFQEKLPENCRVMNPQRVEGVYHILLFCSTEGAPYLLKRSLKQ